MACDRVSEWVLAMATASGAAPWKDERRSIVLAWVLEARVLVAIAVGSYRGGVAARTY
ncbi:hypothetical protein CC80DRAFT_489403 [Byssothecium circinans]|uniref:Uncharacterized protein n=1 Tax=Byssothecium circinans TaxID=147558 RepID=A0A6A5U793_9PLEO|nr:hypothetical protein CC80DRAFT_489403 [Byssothecium circinans]